MEPITGLGTGYQFVRAAQTAAERRSRIATLAAFLAASGRGAVTSDVPTNGALGAAVASHISYMRGILAREGGATGCKLTKLQSSFKAPVFEIDLFRAQFDSNCKIIIHNIFKEQATHRYLQVSTNKIKTVAPIYLVAMTSGQMITFIGWTSLGVGVIGFTIFGSLYLFQRAERNRYQLQNDEALVDVDVIASMSQSSSFN